MKPFLPLLCLLLFCFDYAYTQTITVPKEERKLLEDDVRKAPRKSKEKVIAQLKLAKFYLKHGSSKEAKKSAKSAYKLSKNIKPVYEKGLLESIELLINCEYADPQKSMDEIITYSKEGAPVAEKLKDDRRRLYFLGFLSEHYKEQGDLEEFNLLESQIRDLIEKNIDIIRLHKDTEDLSIEKEELVVSQDQIDQ